MVVRSGAMLRKRAPTVTVGGLTKKRKVGVGVFRQVV